MIQMFVVSYPAEHQAVQVIAALQNPNNEHLDIPKSVALLSKDAEGKLHLHICHNAAQYENTWIFLMELLYMALSSGLLTFAAQLSKFGIDEHFVNRLNATLGRKGSAIFIAMPIMTGDKILPALSRFGGIVLQTLLSEQAAAPLHEDLVKPALSA